MQLLKYRQYSKTGANISNAGKVIFYSNDPLLIKFQPPKSDLKITLKIVFV